MGLKWRIGTGAALFLAFGQTAVAGSGTQSPPSSTSTAGTAASAQQASTGEPEADIIVNGRRMTAKEYREQVANFVRDTGVAAGLTPAARWIQPVCPKAMGLSGDQAARVEAQLRKIAEETGVPVARTPCTTNVAVTFTNDAKGVVRTIQKRASGRLAEMSPGARASLLEGDAPVRWWYTTDLVSRYGAVKGSMNPTTTLDGFGNLPGADKAHLGHYTSSVVSTQVMRSLDTATVVVDVTKAQGVSLEALASYAALVSFAEINARDAAPPASILGNLKPGGPAELTDMDMTFLRALYRLSLDREARAHRGSLVDKMIKRDN